MQPQRFRKIQNEGKCVGAFYFWSIYARGQVVVSCSLWSSRCSQLHNHECNQNSFIWFFQCTAAKLTPPPVPPAKPSPTLAARIKPCPPPQPPNRPNRPKTKPPPHRHQWRASLWRTRDVWVSKEVCDLMTEPGHKIRPTESDHPLKGVVFFCFFYYVFK